MRQITERATTRAFALGGSLALCAVTVFAQAPVPLSDAQVEANVLKALAGASDLAGEAITTHTVYGVVTLSGTVANEARRTKAESLTANANGVTKVVDELQLGQGDTVENHATEPQNGAAQPLVLQSDGSYAPAQTNPATPSASEPPEHPAPGSAPAAGAQRNDPDNDQALDQQATNTQPVTAPAGRRPLDTNPMSSQPEESNPGTYPGQASLGHASLGQANSGQAQRYPAPGNRNASPGQPAGRPALIPSGSLLQVRVDRTLASDRTPAGTTFTGIVMNDVIADGYVAIPRGAAVAGTVVEAVRSGTLKGRGEMSVTLNSVSLGGRVYPLTTDLWAHHGGDKTIETVNKTAGFGAVGALIGALAGGGVGAAVGGGVGAAAGLGSSAASGNGQVVLPAEAVVPFRLAQPAAVVTVSQQEMQRLATNSYPRSPYGYEPGRPRIVGGPVYPRWGYPAPYPMYYPGPYPPPPPYGYPPY